MKMKFIALLLLILMPFIFISPPNAQAFSNPATVDMLTVDNFAALAKILISSPTGSTVLNNGDLGIDDPGECTGFESPCTGVDVGTINNGAIQYQNAVALQGQTDSTALVGDLNGRTPDDTLIPQLGGLALTQGVYEVSAAATNLTGTLTLSGDANSVFIFQMTSTLITDAGSSVVLTGGARACNVFWTVASAATFNDDTAFVGTVLAGTSVTFPGGGATLDGRAIAQTASITFNNTTINNSSCATAAAASTSAGDASSTDASTSGQVPRINVTKTANPLALPEGSGPVTYTYQVTNTGELPLSQVTLMDNKCAPVHFLSGDRNSDGLLDLDEIWTYRCTEIVSTSVTNIATAHGFAEGVDVYDTAQARVVVGTPSPSPIVPQLPNTGVDPHKHTRAWYTPIIIFIRSLFR